VIRIEEELSFRKNEKSDGERKVIGDDCANRKRFVYLNTVWLIIKRKGKAKRGREMEKGSEKGSKGVGQ